MWVGNGKHKRINEWKRDKNDVVDDCNIAAAGDVATTADVENDDDDDNYDGGVGDEV